MIGNDVIDLKVAQVESNWRRKGYLKKVFTESEQRLIWESENKNVVVWTLWSMKEAAYKAHQRLYGLPRRLNWKLQQCDYVEETESKVRGVVNIGKQRYYTRSGVTSEFIYTAATKDSVTVINSCCKRESMENLKILLLREISQLLKISEHKLLLKKDCEGVPFISYNNENIFSSFSLSDHGNYAGFSLSLTNC